MPNADPRTLTVRTTNRFAILDQPLLLAAAQALALADGTALPVDARSALRLLLDRGHGRTIDLAPASYGLHMVVSRQQIAAESAGGVTAAIARRRRARTR